MPTVHVVSAQARVIARIRSGAASVVRSRSLGRPPRNTSRTGPPTSASSCPDLVKSSPRAATVGEVFARSRAAAALLWSALKVAFWATEVDSDTGIQGIYLNPL